MRTSQILKYLFIRQMIMKEKEFNPDKIRELFILKFARLTKNLPDFESVVNDLRLMLDFIKVK
ncbi:MAG: hypothetical protein MPEBLZ_04403 [Candidatus Methanoperedens nitroreducens]|uniref:Uncharacterized protein n=1 Tax=Candidatus Methanoperedens nitratireducens TaxID=1392998 RepID=A0A0P8CF13_9EURY|nr:MAG: hypothetical protein MPEBLZ_04403 [Candidatus Methanoperedens sp. BLZ1]